MTVRISGTAVAQSHRRMFIKMEEKTMKERDRMKILIAYDGSECAESAIDDLKRAGLPRRAEAAALTIAEELFPAPTSIGGVCDGLRQGPIGGREGFTGAGQASALANPLD